MAIGPLGAGGAGLYVCREGFWDFEELEQLCSRARVISWPREEKINFQVGHNFVWLYNGMHLMVVHDWYRFLLTLRPRGGSLSQAGRRHTSRNSGPFEAGLWRLGGYIQLHGNWE